MPRSHLPAFLMWVCFLTWGAAEAAAADDGAQVVLVVDTSGSMTTRGMDPERASLLVSRLYSDIVPGDFAVVRLLDLQRDRAVLPQSPTGAFVACDEDPSARCERVEQSGNWGEAARTAIGPARAGFGVEVRAGLSDAPRFKEMLDRHLAQTANNSLFHLGFRSAQGFFDEGRRGGPRRQFLLWLSDGKAEARNDFLAVANEVMQEGVSVEALVFGRGDTTLAEQLHLTPRRTTSPAEIMGAFADIFRRVVQAPFRADGEVAARPTFTMKPHIREAWVVVYGDTSLSSAWIEGPGGRIECDDAQDAVPRAGAYRVAHIDRPTAGEWSVHTIGGGAGAAYAAIQRPGLRPVFVGPSRAPAGADTPLIAAIESELDSRRVVEPELLDGIKVSIDVDGQHLDMFDDGTHGDRTANDGEFTALFAFPRVGPSPVVVHGTSETMDGTADGSVEVEAGLRYSGGPITIDMGSVRWGETRCVPLPFAAEISAPTQVRAQTLGALPAEHTILVRGPAGDVGVDTPFTLAAGDRLELCLAVGEMAPSSALDAVRLVQIGAGDLPENNVPVIVSWRVEGRPWWIRYRMELLGSLLALVAVFVAYGFIWPFRFERRMGLRISSSPDADGGGFYAFKQIRGTGAGWYRHALAFLHDNYRVSGPTALGRQPRGAVARFRARGKGVRMEPLSGSVIECQGADGTWEPIGEGERPAAIGRLYRVATAKDLYFEVRRG